MYPLSSSLSMVITLPLNALTRLKIVNLLLLFWIATNHVGIKIILPLVVISLL